MLRSEGKSFHLFQLQTDGVNDVKASVQTEAFTDHFQRKFALFKL